jgi:hypothetical protein
MEELLIGDASQPALVVYVPTFTAVLPKLQVKGRLGNYK